MSLLLITAISMGISLVIDDLYILLIYKTIADLGYKPAPGEINGLPGQIYRSTALSTMIPIINVLSRILFYKKLDDSLTLAFDYLKEHEIIIEMTTEELKDYEKRRNGIHAYKTFKKIQDKEDKIQSIYMMIGDKENEIFYRIENKKMVIIKVEGPMNDIGLSKEEIEGLIQYSWQSLFRSGIKLQGSKFFKELRKYNSYELKSKENIEKGIDEIQFHYRYKDLKETFKYLNNIEPANEKIKTLGSIKKQ